MIKVQKFIKKPSEILAVQWDGTESSIHSGVLFRKEGTSWQIYNRLHDSWIIIKIGDYYRVDIDGDNYPIDAKYMEENYIEVEE